jgi:hypothetical protein
LVRVVAQNVSTSRPLATTGRVELAFDRYLLPASITRQTFQTSFAQPAIAYDPVGRIVTIVPRTPLLADQSYVIHIASPSGPSDRDGLRAIDGATIDPLDATIEFPVVASDGGPAGSPPPIDFCRDILPIFTGKCSGGQCHGSPYGAAGVTAAAALSLDSAQSVAQTAVGRVAQGTNTGPSATPLAPGIAFGVDMPIIDPGGGDLGGGNPGNSWLLYKLLLAIPPPYSSTSDAGACTGEQPTDVGSTHVLAPPALTDPTHDPARASLANAVLGREMPFPGNPAEPLGASPEPLTIVELERVSRWIAQDPASGGPLVPDSCCGH